MLFLFQTSLGEKKVTFSDINDEQGTPVVLHLHVYMYWINAITCFMDLPFDSFFSVSSDHFIFMWYKFYICMILYLRALFIFF